MNIDSDSEQNGFLKSSMQAAVSSVALLSLDSKTDTFLHKQIYMAVCTTYVIVCVCDTLHIQTFINKVT